MFERALRKYTVRELLCVGLGTGALLGFCAGIVASIEHRIFNVQPGWEATATIALFCLLFGYTKFPGISIGLTIGCAITLVMTLAIGFSLRTGLEVAGGTVVIGMTAMIFGWGLQSLVRERSEKSV